MNDELKPCPFCGAPGEVRWYIIAEGEPDPNDTIQCSTGCVENVMRETWNTRPEGSE